jgi:hypothetical protein
MHINETWHKELAANVMRSAPTSSGLVVLKWTGKNNSPEVIIKTIEIAISCSTYHRAYYFKFLQSTLIKILPMKLRFYIDRRVYRHTY